MGPYREKQVHILAGPALLAGGLALVPEARGIVLFAHGSGSSRHSPRNRSVAMALQDAGFSTLLMDLLTAEEEALDRHTGHLRFDVELLAKRLVHATKWLMQSPETSGLSIGYFGASTGAAAAILAAAAHPQGVGAIVSRGGRPDLAGNRLRRIQAPTLLVVGEYDEAVLRMNEEALLQLSAVDKQMAVVSAATHLFEEPGALDEVARLACQWFERFLSGPSARQAGQVEALVLEKL